MTMPNSRRRRWPYPGALVTLLLVLTLAPGAMPAAAQSLADGHAQVIAQGTAGFSSPQYTWWVGWHPEPTAAEGVSPYRNLGFVLGDTGVTTIVSDGALGSQLVWLDPGEALFVQADTYQERYAASQSASHYSLDLLPAGAVDPLAQPIGAPIVPDSSVHELSLIRDVLFPGETGFLPGSFQPVLVLATAGAIQVSPDNGAAFVLEAGQSATITAAAAITDASAVAASYVAAFVTPRIQQAPVAGVADLGLWVLSCPPGVTARPDMTNRGCIYVDALASGLGLTISGPALSGPLTLGNSGLGDAGARVWSGVPFGFYTLTATLPPGAIGYAVRPVLDGFPISLLPDGTGYSFTIDGSLFDPRGDYWRVNFEVYLLYP